MKTSGSPSGVLERAVVVVPALGVVVRHRADERQLHLGHLLLDEPVGVDHAERVLPRVEARHLREQRPLDVDAELVDDVGRVLRRQRHVLRCERIDRRRPDVRGRQALRPRRVLGQVEDRRVVARDRREQELEHLRVRRGEVDVPAPDPVRLRLREVVDEAERLRVVDDHEVVVVLELARVQLLVAAEDLLVRRRRGRARRPAARCGSSS